MSRRLLAVASILVLMPGLAPAAHAQRKPAAPARPVFDVVEATIPQLQAALAEADSLDRERAAGKLRGPLHGIPVALKDNITPPTCPPRAARSRSRT